jgi:hypothetical protein
MKRYRGEKKRQENTAKLWRGNRKKLDTKANR